jgi:hypothetical protein
MEWSIHRDLAAMAVKTRKAAQRMRGRGSVRGPAHIPLDAHEREEKRLERARRVAAVESTFAPEATRTRRAARRPVAKTAAASTEIFDPKDGSGSRLTSPMRTQPDGDRRCVAFALAAALETWLARVHASADDLPILSVEHIFKLGDGQEIVSPAASGVRNGVLETDCFDASPPCPDAPSRTWRGIVARVDDNRTESLCQLLRVGRPIVSEMRIFENFSAFRGTETYVPEGKAIGAHALVIIGFERASDGSGLWIVRNSYGEEWGEDGFGRIRWRDPFCKPERVVFMVREVSRGT